MDLRRNLLHLWSETNKRREWLLGQSFWMKAVGANSNNSNNHIKARNQARKHQQKLRIMVDRLMALHAARTLLMGFLLEQSHHNESLTQQPQNGSGLKLNLLKYLIILQRFHVAVNEQLEKFERLRRKAIHSSRKNRNSRTLCQIAEIHFNWDPLCVCANKNKDLPVKFDPLVDGQRQLWLLKGFLVLAKNGLKSLRFRCKTGKAKHFRNKRVFGSIFVT